MLQPLRSTRAMALALGCGINPRYGQIDPYWMALARAMRRCAMSWPWAATRARPRSSTTSAGATRAKPDRLAGLVRAAAGCYDAARGLGTPFISGKDSLNNEYRDASGARTPIPPTLLITALALVPDIAAP